MINIVTYNYAILYLIQFILPPPSKYYCPCGDNTHYYKIFFT